MQTQEQSCCFALVFWLCIYRIYSNKKKKHNILTLQHPKLNFETNFNFHFNPTRNVVLKIGRFLYQQIHMNFTKQQIKNHSEGVMSVAFYAILPFLATGGLYGAVILYNITTSSPAIQYQLKNHTDTFSCINFHPNQPLLATASYDNTAIIYNMATEPPTKQHHFKHHKYVINSIDFHSSFLFFITGSDDRTAILYDLTTVPATIYNTSLQKPSRLGFFRCFSPIPFIISNWIV